MLRSLRKAASEQGLNEFAVELERIVPDISRQYSTFILDTPYLKTKARMMHAFQISLLNKIIGEFKNPVIVDIGDSAGTHLQYLIGLYSKDKQINCLSINIAADAVEKIKTKGLAAIQARAEDLHEYKMNTDIFLCFEVLEHLMDPCRFLHQLSSKTDAKYLIITMPYLRSSRVGLKHIRNAWDEHVCAENTHFFELEPEDWKLLLRHSGWDIVEEKVYLQYPKRSFLKVTRPLWKKFDYEGFYGAVLKRDKRYSSKYKDW